MTPRWWRPEPGERPAYRCGLCFRNCLVPLGETGWCGARRAAETGFSSPYLGRFCSAAVDPIEKKPLYHWQPGTLIFSLGSLGCTMRCPFCQNHTIAQPRGEMTLADLPPAALLKKVKELQLPAVAYTYNEPTLQAEYILEAAPLLRAESVATVLVTNGLFSQEVLTELAPWLDAVNVDVKTFNSDHYAEMGGSLKTVKRNVAQLVQAGVHVELTTLVVPGLSDDQEEFTALTEWVAALSPQIPLHISRYFPKHLFTAPATEIGLLKQFQSIAQAKLRHVHLGNVR